MDSLSLALSESLNKKTAEIARSATVRPHSMQKIVIPLDTAATESNPYRLSFPFSSVFVRDATDSLTNVYLNGHSDDIQQIQNAIQLKINDSFSFQETISKAYLTWAAQAGKTVTLYLFLGAEMKSGSQLSLNAGGLSINSGSALSVSVVNLATATATQIVGVNASRKQATFVNDSGATIYVGGSTVAASGSNKGIPVVNGASFVWQNTAALYGYSVAGYSALSVMSES